MTQFGRTKVILSGFDGAPGVNIFNWCAPAHGDITQEHVDEFHDILNTSYDALTAYFFALGVRWTIDSGVSVHEVDSGEMSECSRTEEVPTRKCLSGLVKNREQLK